jgi:hypothetical protein
VAAGAISSERELISPPLRVLYSVLKIAILSRLQSLQEYLKGLEFLSVVSIITVGLLFSLSSKIMLEGEDGLRITFSSSAFFSIQCSFHLILMANCLMPSSRSPSMSSLEG